MITSVQNVMTRRLVTVPAGIPLKEAYELMSEKRIRHLPVIGRQNEILGVVSSRDPRLQSLTIETPVETAMSTSLEFVNEDLPLRQAILQMLQKQIDCLFVLDPEKRASGLVTKDDLLWHLAHLLREESDEQPLLTARAQQTIGEVAHELSMMGI